MIKSCKIRIYPNKSQIKIIDNTLGCCNWIKNKYLEINIKRYKEDESFISGYDFSKYINHLKKNNPNYYWLKEYSSKAIKDAIMSKEKAYKDFFKSNKGFPKFKSRKRLNKESYFFIKDNIHYTDNKYIIKLPILGEVRITEHGYLPDIETINSGRIIREYDKYYVMLIYETNTNHIKTYKSNNIGIDLGVKNYATISSKDKSYFITHFKDDERYKDIQNKINKLQTTISKKVEINYGKLLNKFLDIKNGEEPNEIQKNIMKGESYKTTQIRKLRKKMRSLNKRLNNIRCNYINKLVNLLTVRTKPSTITIEDLDISDIISHDHEYIKKLHDNISKSNFYYFRQCLINKCYYYGITLRIADRYYPSSKICSCCGHKKKDLVLSDRIYHCDKCGLEINRDINASINLLNMKDKHCIMFKYA